jgi:hypothetical protein
MDVSTASVHLDRTQTEMGGSNPRRLDTLFKPRRLPGRDRTLFVRFHKIRRIGAIGGSVGSGREFTLQLPFPLYVSDIPRPSPTTRAVLGPKNLALGGACTDANPLARLTGRRFYSKQDCPRICLVDVFCGWECSPTTW